MGFEEYAVGTDGNSSFTNGFDHFRAAAADPAGLVGLLQGMGDIGDHGHTVFLHPGDIPEIHHQVLVTEHAPAFGEHHSVIPRLPDLLYRVLHR